MIKDLIRVLPFVIGLVLTCGGNLVMGLEGGYHLETLVASVKAVLNTLSDRTRTATSGLLDAADPKKVGYAVSRCVHVHRQYWRCLDV